MAISFRNYVSRNISNIKGWRTEKKIVVIESDDWGSVRMPSSSVYTDLLNKGIRVDKCPYNKFDSLESKNDLERIFEVLLSIKDWRGNHPIITANSVVANPNFEKIKSSYFEEYFFEKVSDTYLKYNSKGDVFETIQKGLSESVFFPQFHAREHLNVARWMKALKNRLPETIFAFERGVFGLSTNITSEKRRSYLAALEYDSEDDLLDKNIILDSGLSIFEELYGYKSESFIAPNYIWGNQSLSTLSRSGVKYIQGMRVQLHPDPINNKNIQLPHSLGETNELDQTYLIRNCTFEPTLEPSIDSLNTCLSEIQIAFFWNKPAIISTHRVNFMGGIDNSNGENNINLFKQLLKAIVTKWPDVEFMTSNQLGQLIANR